MAVWAARHRGTKLAIQAAVTQVNLGELRIDVMLGQVQFVSENLSHRHGGQCDPIALLLQHSNSSPQVPDVSLRLPG